jgi:hypothetical protein
LFTSVTVLRKEQATTEAVRRYFDDQEFNCFIHGKKDSKRKYLLMVYYTGVCRILNGTQRVGLHDDDNFPLENRIRNFKNKYSKNAYVWGIFDSGRISRGGTRIGKANR